MLHQQQTSHLGQIEHGLQQQVPGDDDVAARTRGRASSDATGSEGGPLQASGENYFNAVMRCRVLWPPYIRSYSPYNRN